MEKIFEKVLLNLKNNNMEAYFAEKKEDIPEIVKGLLKKGEVISCGGSVTLSQCGVIELMKNGDYVFLDRSVPGLTREEIEDIYKKTFSADALITSVNALTQEGELINVDGNGNRVAAMLFGPASVICVVGKNKLVSDVREGFHRIKTVAAPLNAKRLNMQTPCASLGHCIYPDSDITKGCLCEDRICSHYTVCGLQRKKNRIKVILCGEDLGY